MSEPKNAHQQAQDNAHQSLSQEEAETVIKPAETVDAEITGLDLITVENEPYVIEVNASPRFRRLLNTAGINAAQKTAECALTKGERQPCCQLSSADPQRSLHSLV